MGTFIWTSRAFVRGRESRKPNPISILRVKSCRIVLGIFVQNFLAYVAAKLDERTLKEFSTKNLNDFWPPTVFKSLVQVPDVNRRVGRFYVTSA